jgi:pullulanase/glycogen debranching enzyme
MKKGIDLRSQLPLADMHVDGVRFDLNILKALQQEKAGNSNSLANSPSKD